MKTIKIYTPKTRHDVQKRADWFELLKSKERRERKGNEIDTRLQQAIEWVEQKEQADLWMLPMDWKYYKSEGTIQAAMAFCEEAAAHQKPVWTFNGGDYGLELDVPKTTRVYRMSGYQSLKTLSDSGMPFFLSDPVEHVLGISEEELFMNEQKEPVIGFCGMAPHGLPIFMREWFLAALHNVKRNLSKPRLYKQPWFSTSNLRHRVMQVFEIAGNWKTDFVVHQKHRAGAETELQRKISTQNYYEHMLRSDLMICARGAGNFSVRFYETLAMGRIPVFIDTDCLLPDIGGKNWHDYLIWVDKKDITHAPEIAAKWLEGKDLTEQKKKNRELWKQHLRMDSFWLNQLQDVKNQ